MFLSIDGGDGAGKSTQVQLLREYLESRGVSVLTCRDPGSTKLGEEVRNILLHSDDLHISDRSELFLFMTARAQMVEEIIRPARAEGKTVIVDRFLLSTVVYQGHAAGVPVADIWSVGKIALAGCSPDLTIVLDIDPEKGIGRIDRPLDRMEMKGIEYHQRVRDGFRKAAGEWSDHFPGRCEIVSAAGSPGDVAAEIQKLVFK